MPAPAPAQNPDLPIDVRAIRRAGSSFRSAEPGSAIWFAERGGRLYVLRSQGASVVEAVQCSLGVQPDGFWGLRTNDALRRAMEARGIDPKGVRSGAVTHAMLEAALKVAFPVGEPGDFGEADRVILPPAAPLPRWLKRGPSDGAYRGLVFGGPATASADMPPAETHPRYGAASPCSPEGRVYVVDEVQVTSTGRVFVMDEERVPELGAGGSYKGAGSLGGGPEGLRPFFSYARPITSAGDAPSPLRAFLFGAVLAAAGVVAAVLIDDDADEPSGPDEVRW